MKWFITLIILTSSFLYSNQVYSESLTVQRLESFSQHVLKVTRDSPKSLYDYLSEKLEVESSMGSSSQGLTLFFNKSQYIKAMDKIIQGSDENFKDIEVNIFDHIVNSADKGQFTVTTYSKVIKAKVWTTYHVELKDNKLLITKIFESA